MFMFSLSASHGKQTGTAAFIISPAPYGQAKFSELDMIPGCIYPACCYVQSETNDLKIYMLGSIKKDELVVAVHCQADKMWRGCSIRRQCSRTGDICRKTAGECHRISSGKVSYMHEESHPNSNIKCPFFLCVIWVWDPCACLQAKARATKLHSSSPLVFWKQTSVCSLWTQKRMKVPRNGWNLKCVFHSAK